MDCGSSEGASIPVGRVALIYPYTSEGELCHRANARAEATGQLTASCTEIEASAVVSMENIWYAERTAWDDVAGTWSGMLSLADLVDEVIIFDNNGGYGNFQKIYHRLKEEFANDSVHATATCTIAPAGGALRSPTIDAAPHLRGVMHVTVGRPSSENRH